MTLGVRLFTFEKKRCSNSRVDTVAAKNCRAGHTHSRWNVNGEHMKIAYIETDSDGVGRDFVERAVSEAGHDFIVPADYNTLDEKSVFDLFRAQLAEVDLIVAEVSDLTPLGSLQIGAALQAGKPIVSIARTGSDIPPSVLQSGAYLTYQMSDKVGDVRRRLIESINKFSGSTAMHPDVTTQQPQQREHKLFISYSHKDKAYLERLLVHLRPLERAGRIELWSDTQLRTGDRWKKEIQNALERATIAVMLVSADFMASEFIVNNELPPLLKNAEERGTKILPLIIKPCRFVRDPDLSQFQAANIPSRAFILLSEGEQEALLDQVAAEVERFVGTG